MKNLTENDLLWEGVWFFEFLQEESLIVLRTANSSYLQPPSIHWLTVVLKCPAGASSQHLDQVDHHHVHVPAIINLLVAGPGRDLISPN